MQWYTGMHYSILFADFYREGLNNINELRYCSRADDELEETDPPPPSQNLPISTTTSRKPTAAAAPYTSCSTCIGFLSCLEDSSILSKGEGSRWVIYAQV